MHRWHTNTIELCKDFKFQHMLNNSVSTLITSSSSLSTARQDIETADAAATALTALCVRACVRACERACVRACDCMRACMRVCIHSRAPSLIRSFLDTFNASYRDGQRVIDLHTWHQFICQATGIWTRLHTATWLGHISRRLWRRRSHILECDTGSRRSTARGLLRASRSSSVHIARSCRRRGLCQPTSPSCPREPATVRQLAFYVTCHDIGYSVTKSQHYGTVSWHFRFHEWYVICWSVVIISSLALCVLDESWGLRNSVLFTLYRYINTYWYIKCALFNMQFNLTFAFVYK